MAADAGRRRDGRRPDADLRRRHRPRRLGHRHLVRARRVRPPPAALPRPRRHRPRVPRGPPAGLGGHHRAPRTARVPGPPGRAAGPGVRAGPPVPVPVLDRRLDLPPRLHRRAAGRHRPGPHPARRLRRADRADRLVAPAAGTGGRGARRRPQPPRPPPLRARDDRRAGQGGPRHGQRHPADRRAPDVVGAVVRAGVTRPLAERGVADARLVGVRGRLRRARSCTWPTGSTPRPATSCWCWWPAAASRPTSGRRSASSGSSAGSGSTRRGGWPGWRTSRTPSSRTATSPCPSAWTTPSASSTSRSATPGPTASSSTTSTSRCPPAAWSPSSARTGPGRRPWSSCCAGCTRRPAAASSWTAPTWPGSPTTRGAGSWPAPCRTSSASSSPPS